MQSAFDEVWGTNAQKGHTMSFLALQDTYSAPRRAGWGQGEAILPDGTIPARSRPSSVGNFNTVCGPENWCFNSYLVSISVVYMLFVQRFILMLPPQNHTQPDGLLISSPPAWAAFPVVVLPPACDRTGAW